MEEIKQHINLQMKKMLEIFETIISFDIFFQKKEFKKSKSIFSYIVFIFLSVGSYISIFPERLVINPNLLSNLLINSNTNKNTVFGMTSVCLSESYFFLSIQ